MQLEIQTETAEAIMRDMLLQDLHNEAESVANLKLLRKSQQGQLHGFQEEDLKAAKKIVKALKVVLQYYNTHEDYIAIMEEL